MYAAYSIQEHRIYWFFGHDLMTLKINENKTTEIASFDHDIYNLYIDWVVRNLYFTYEWSGYSYIVKFDLTMWEIGIIKFDEIFKSEIATYGINILPSMGYVYYRPREKIIYH